MQPQMPASAGKWAPLKNGTRLGVEDTIKAMEAAGNKPAQWVYDMLATGAKSFYKIETETLYYDISSKGYKIIPGTEGLFCWIISAQQIPYGKTAELPLPILAMAY
jgi:hypothetical protein